MNGFLCGSRDSLAGYESYANLPRRMSSPSPPRESATKSWEASASCVQYEKQTNAKLHLREFFRQMTARRQGEGQ
jgi:hypothetical protein